MICVFYYHSPISYSYIIIIIIMIIIIIIIIIIISITVVKPVDSFMPLDECLSWCLCDFVLLLNLQ